MGPLMDIVAEWSRRQPRSGSTERSSELQPSQLLGQPAQVRILSMSIFLFWGRAKNPPQSITSSVEPFALLQQDRAPPNTQRLVVQLISIGFQMRGALQRQ